MSKSDGHERVAAIGRNAALAASALLLVFVSFSYALRPDGLAAVTLWPPWIWLLPGLLPVLIGAVKPRLRFTGVVGAAWGLFLLGFGEEPRSLVRPVTDLGRPRPEGVLRVVSLNCAGGSAEAAGEVAELRPDIVLLQETPGAKDVHRLADRLYSARASYIAGLDASILLGGEIVERRGSQPVSTFVHGRAQLSRGAMVEVISLRLVPPTIRMDLLSPGCWREHTENRRARLAQVDEMLESAAHVPADAPLIVGGDFNAPTGDAAYRLLSPRLQDAFRSGGRGWGNTILNDIPVSRIDQVWISAHFRPVAVTALRTRHSDHRMVVCDLQLLKR